MVADLDASLARRGEDVVLTRGVASATCRAFVLAYTPQEMIEGTGIQQGDSLVTISPTCLVGWPTAGSGIGPTGDTRIPRRDDRVTIAGWDRAVISAEPRYVDGILVRINLQVRG